MPSNRKPPDNADETAHQKVMDAIARSKNSDAPPPQKDAKKKAAGKPQGPVARLRAQSLHRLDSIAADDGRRLAASILLAVAINAAVLTALAIFGRVRIYAPNTPAQSISIVFVEEPVEPIFPELRDPEIVPEPEPEPEEPEIVEEPDLEDEPEPEPESERDESRQKPEPEKEP